MLSRYIWIFYLVSYCFYMLIIWKGSSRHLICYFYFPFSCSGRCHSGQRAWPRKMTQPGLAKAPSAWHLPPPSSISLDPRSSLPPLHVSSSFQFLPPYCNFCLMHTIYLCRYLFGGSAIKQWTTAVQMLLFFPGCCFYGLEAQYGFCYFYSF
jgi:hypothetical protein